MDLQPCGRWLSLLVGILTLGCAANPATQRPAYSLVAVGSDRSPVRLYRSAHHLLYTTVGDPDQIASIVATLEASYAACVDLTGVRPPADAGPQSVFVFARRAEWEAFTKLHAGADAPLYLKLDRGGYTLGKACVVRDQGEHDTLTVLSHEDLHLFIASHFSARPPPFVEEGLATLLEDVHVDDGIARIDVGHSASRSGRLAAMGESFTPLRTLLSMHAGNVVGLAGTEVDAFYSQAWAFARFLRDGEGGKYRPMLMKLINDAANGALSSDSLADDPALVERYLGASLESIEPAFRIFMRRLDE